MFIILLKVLTRPFRILSFSVYNELEEKNVQFLIKGKNGKR